MGREAGAVPKPYGWSNAMRMRTQIVVVLILASVAVGMSAATGQVYDAWPFDAEEAGKRQAATAKAIGAADPLKAALTKGQALNFRLVLAGTFHMGSPTPEPGHEPDEPLHPETIAEPFYMMETQLT